MPIMSKVLSPATREAILKKVFKKGVESVDESILESLFKRGKRLYRLESNPRRLLEKGFDETLHAPLSADTEHYLIEKGYTGKQIDNFARKGLPKSLENELKDVMGISGNIKSYNEPIYDEPGLYWLHNKRDLKNVVPAYKELAEEENLVKGIRRPKATIADTYAEGKDFLRRGDFETIETVQQKPNNVLAQIKIKGKNYYRILGLGGALGGGLMLDDKEAQAGPKSEIVGAVLKAGSKLVLKGAESSAAKALKGTSFMGKIVKNITKGKGDWRYIILEDDTAYPVNKEVVNSLSRAAGTAKYAAEFEAASDESRLAQAYKSLQLHKVKGETNKERVLDYHTNYKKQLKLAGTQVPEMSLVESEGKHFTLPTNYAKLLLKENAVKILKDLK